MTDTFNQRLDFWEARSGLGFAAGSGDINLKKLEINAILRSIGQPKTILDAGCGNGFTLASLASSLPDSRLFGFDYSQGMVNSAIDLLADSDLGDRVKVCQASLLDSFPSSLSSLDIPGAGFDCIYTERSIINLDSLEQQTQAVQALWRMVVSGGRLVLCEAFLDGLNEINAYREAVGLERISQPWHNRYLSLNELENLLPGVNMSCQVVEFSGTYYFVSRVVHAREVLLEGREPSYDASINQQSLDLPALPLFGQSKIVIFEKP
ncbi:MAG: class I SAM-dependent methyltransferase [Vulcanococcus sp.]|uniref:class I SAM-dependent methyltransferase n=1 Tax=Vulcanococcus sp. TaxID=2856995 RepID=UPI0025D02D45|nr:class I SAM-dependent methyltransferase [Vulcanococcus sp.]MBW0167190.1 class I SAM-dependent methyltransferase [Vulcanococcus sp.]